MTWMFNEMAKLMKEFETENRRIRKENKQKLNDVSKSSNDIYQLTSAKLDKNRNRSKLK